MHFRKKKNDFLCDGGLLPILSMLIKAVASKFLVVRPFVGSFSSMCKFPYGILIVYYSNLIL